MRLIAREPDLLAPDPDICLAVSGPEITELQCEFEYDLKMQFDMNLNMAFELILNVNADVEFNVISSIRILPVYLEQIRIQRWSKSHV